MKLGGVVVNTKRVFDLSIYKGKRMKKKSPCLLLFIASPLTSSPSSSSDVTMEEGGTTTSDMGETPTPPSSPPTKDKSNHDLVKHHLTHTTNTFHADSMSLTAMVPILPPLFADLVSCGELMIAYQQEAHAHKVYTTHHPHLPYQRIFP